MVSTKKYSSFPHVQHEHMKIMNDCLSICAACSAMCVKEGHKETAILCSECADICALTIKWHSADSEFNPQVMALCADVCTKCAEACSKNKAQHCQECAEICKECAKACRHS